MVAARQARTISALNRQKPRGRMHVYRTHVRQYTIATIAAIASPWASAGCKSTQPAAPAIDDATLSAALQSRIAGDSALSTEAIQSSVQNGVATLNGNVSSEAARSLAAADAAQIAGIRTVVNNLTVQQPAPAVAAVAPSTPAPVAPAAPKACPPRSSSPARTSTGGPNRAPDPAAVAQQEPTPPPAPAPAPAASSTTGLP